MTEFEKELVKFVSGYLDAGVSAEDYVKAFSKRLLDSIGRQCEPKVCEELGEEINRWMGSADCFPEGVGISPLPKEDIKNGSYISAFLQANCGDSVILKEATMWFMSRLKQLPIQQSKLEVCEGLEEEIQNQIYNHFFDLHGIAIAGTTAYATVEDMVYIARHFYSLGRQSKEQPVCEELGREMDRFFTSEEYEEAEKAGFGETHLARHFAKWGADHLRDTTKKMSEDLEKLRDLTHEVRVAYERGIEVGRKEQKEQMMKEAVEGEVMGYIGGDYGMYISVDLPPEIKIDKGDYINLIIVKEE